MKWFCLIPNGNLNQNNFQVRFKLLNNLRIFFLIFYELLPRHAFLFLWVDRFKVASEEANQFKIF